MYLLKLRLDLWKLKRELREHTTFYGWEMLFSAPWKNLKGEALDAWNERKALLESAIRELEHRIQLYRVYHVITH